MKSPVAVISPTLWDRRQLERLPSGGIFARFAANPVGENLEISPNDYDVDYLINSIGQRLKSDGYVGAFSTSDYPGVQLASQLCQLLDFPGPNPKSIIQLSHKHLSRLAQQKFVPEVTPCFRLIDPRHDEDSSRQRYPFFIKPVRSSFSQFASVISDADDYSRFLRWPALNAHLKICNKAFDTFLRWQGLPKTANCLIGEELLKGLQFTLECYIWDGVVVSLGCVDTHFYPGTASFRRFDFPSEVSTEVQTRALDACRRLMAGIELNNTMVNVEFLYDPESDRLSIVEVNPRSSPQFAELFERVYGVNSYEISLSLAVGRRPVIPTSPAFAFASSYVFRIFSDASVIQFPSSSEIAMLERNFYPALIMDLSGGHGKLSNSSHQFDGASYRYCVVNIAANDRTEADSIVREIAARLKFKLAPIPTFESSRLSRHSANSPGVLEFSEGLSRVCLR